MSLTQQYHQPMIDLGSIAGLYEREHELHAYYSRCDRWAVLPLAQMVAMGHGARRLPLRVRCRWCLAVGQLQVRPPMPLFNNANGWTMPSALEPFGAPRLNRSAGTAPGRLILIQSGLRIPERYGESSRLETMPSNCNSHACS